MRTVDDIASAIGYQKIWEAVNTYIKDVRKEMDNAEMSLEQAVFEITEAIKEYEKKEFIISGDNAVTGWFRLADDE